MQLRQSIDDNALALPLDEVYDPAGRYGESLVRETGANALPRLLNGCVGQPDHGERREARAEVDLDLHGGGLEPEDRGAEHVGDHGDEADTEASRGSPWGRAGGEPAV